MLEQMRLADVYVHYDDVAFSKGSFTNRVQLKVPSGSPWLTIPLQGLHFGQVIRDVRTPAGDWRQRHISRLRQVYAETPFSEEMLELVRYVYAAPSDRLCEIVITGMHALADYFDIRPPRILRSSELGISGASSRRVLDIVRALGGDTYVTGLGARRYLAHEMFDQAGIAAAYMRYEMRPYPQQYGPFTPYVSALDLVANLGRAGRAVIASSTMPWREAMAALDPMASAGASDD
jgi:hypothetical protein